MKTRLSEEAIAMRAARELGDGFVVNLGFGIPTLVANYIPEQKHVLWHQENGVVGYGHALSMEELDRADYDLVDNAGHFLSPNPGMCIVDGVDAFVMVRGGHLDATILGALQVSAKGDLANWMTTPDAAPGVGGAMDMAVGAKRVIVVMQHTTRDHKPKILNKCSYPLTAVECVNLIITDLAVVEVVADGLVLSELAPGWTVEEIQALTEPRLTVADDLREIRL